MSQILRTPTHSRDPSQSFHTPLAEYMEGHFNVPELPPSLTDGSSSPLFSSPRSTFQSRYPRLAAVPTPKKQLSYLHGLNSLSSSPPDASRTPVRTSRPELEPPYEPHRLESADFANAITRESNLFAKSLEPPIGESALAGRKHQRDLSDSCEFISTSSKLGFVIDREGRASLNLGTHERSRKKSNAMSSKEITTIINADSDSEDESEFGPGVTGASDAVSAFARTLARSKVGKLESKSLVQATKKVPETEEQEVYYFSSEREPQTPTSSGSLRESCLRISHLLQASTATPPGSVFTLENFNTGMTPYMPRS